MNLSSARLCQALAYQFRNENVLAEALTHRSATVRNNERLEFLGDSILNCVIAGELFNEYPQASEGELSRLRASLVNQDTLAGLARILHLGEYLNLGGGELKSGGFRRASILADALEAVFGAVYLDSDFATCRQVILRLYSNALANLPDVNKLKDPKTRLQEFLQARQQALPTYNVLEITGEAHDQRFKIECVLTEICTVAVGTSRRKAEQEAARKALELLE